MVTPPAILSSRWLVNVNVVLTVEDIVITSKETILSYTRAYRNKEYTSPITISFLYEDYNFYHSFYLPLSWASPILISNLIMKEAVLTVDMTNTNIRQNDLVYNFYTQSKTE